MNKVQVVSVDYSRLLLVYLHPATPFIPYLLQRHDEGWSFMALEESSTLIKKKKTRTEEYCKFIKVKNVKILVKKSEICFIRSR